MANQSSNASLAPLLSDDEINQLIFSSVSLADKRTQKQITSKRAGDLASDSKGGGMDFADYRQYQMDDDPRHIDWRASARSQHVLLRTYHCENQQAVCFLIDRRSSMRFGTKKRLKVTQAVRVALMLAGQSVKKGYDVNALIVNENQQWLKALKGVAGVKQLAELATRPCPIIDAETNELTWKTLLASIRHQVPQGSQLVLISDFYDLSEDATSLLRKLGQVCKTTAIQIVDPSETNPKSLKGLQLIWGATEGGDMAENITKKLIEWQTKHQTFLTSTFNKANVSYQQLSCTDDNLAQVTM